MKIQKVKLGSRVIVYDRYRFAKPLCGIVTAIETAKSIEVKLSESNSNRYPVGERVWVFVEQLKKQKTTFSEV